MGDIPAREAHIPGLVSQLIQPVAVKGRPKILKDEELRSVRDGLFYLLDETWGEVGLAFHMLDRSSNFPGAFNAWEKRNQMYVVQLLLKPNAPEAAARASALIRTSPRKSFAGMLRKMEQRIYCLHEIWADVYKEIYEVRDRLRNLDQALASEITPGPDEHQLICIRSRLLEELAMAEEKQATASQERRDTEVFREELHAQFVRHQVVEFCQSFRYTLNPRNIANALAGLPRIGWRQSAKRCSAWAIEPGGMRYRIFQAIERMIESCTGEADLVSVAELWLTERRASKSAALRHLMEKWRYLRLSIEAVLKVDRQPDRSTPYAICSDFFKRTSLRTPSDLVLEEDVRIS